MLKQLIDGCLSFIARCDLLRQRFTNYGVCAFKQWFSAFSTLFLNGHVTRKVQEQNVFLKQGILSAVILILNL